MFTLFAGTWAAAFVGLFAFLLALAVGGRLLGYPVLRLPVNHRSARITQLATTRDPFVAGAFSERRRFVRRTGQSVAVALADDRQRIFGTGLVVDRSMGGLGMYTESPIEKGTILKVRPTEVDGITVWVQVVVRNNRFENGFHKVGCEYTERPPYSIQLLFG